MSQIRFFMIFVFCCFLVNVVQFVLPEATGVTEISASNKSSNDTLELEINKSNTFLEKINKTLNQTNVLYGKQTTAYENANTHLQEIKQSLNQTNTILKDLDNSSITSFDLTQRLEDFRFQVGVIAGIESSIIGSVTVLLGERLITRKTENRQIDKTHDLINDDLNRITNNVNVILLEIHLLRSQLRNTQNIQQEILQKSGLVESNISRILVNIRLLNWNAIVSGGYLIKLKTEEIRHLQSLYDFLEDARRNYLNTYNVVTDNIVKICDMGFPPNVALPRITDQLQNLIAFFHLKYPTVIERIQKSSSEINWVQLKN